MVKTDFEIEVTGSGTIPKRRTTAFEVDRPTVCAMLRRARNAQRHNNVEGKVHVTLKRHGLHAYSIHTTREDWWTCSKLMALVECEA